MVSSGTPPGVSRNRCPYLGYADYRPECAQPRRAAGQPVRPWPCWAWLCLLWLLPWPQPQGTGPGGLPMAWPLALETPPGTPRKRLWDAGEPGAPGRPPRSIVPLRTLGQWFWVSGMGRMVPAKACS